MTPVLDRLRRRASDEGSALIMVLGAMTVAMLVVSVALNYALQTSGTAQRSTAWNQAFAAAQSGVDDYLARLNKNDNYWSTVDCTNQALRGRTSRTNTCGWNTGTTPGWLPVTGSAGAQFHYDVDVTSTPSNGTIDIVATGRVGTNDAVTRSIEVTLRRGGFGEFLYATTYETKDPADYVDKPLSQGGDGMSPTQATKCEKYYWAGRSSDCVNITFIGGDKLNGPVHSNDSILMTDGASTNPRGPWFTGTVTTSNPSCKPVDGVPRAATYCFRNGNSSGTASPRFDKGIAYRSEVELPESIGDLRQYVLPTNPAASGCLYTGATRIQFLSNATMKVWSPGSTGTTLRSGCGISNGTWPQTLTVPPNGLILVQNVPSTQTQPAAGPCPAGVFGTAPAGGNLPNVDDYNQTLTGANCRLGTAYVDGTLKGRVTVSAENDVVVTGSLLYQGGETGTDALGLIAENSTQIYHPISKGQCTQSTYSGGIWWNGRYYGGTETCTGWAKGTTNLTGSVKGITVDAAILTLQHSFEVQQYDVGTNSCVAGSPSCLGKLRVFGSVAQKFRGIVGRGSTGYLKDYNYDSRLRYAPPPYFLDPVRASWGPKTFGEVAPRYRS